MRATTFLLFILFITSSSTFSQLQLDQTFESLPFPPSGWSTNYFGNLYWERSSVGAQGLSSHSARFSFYEASGFGIQSLTTQTFSAASAGDSLTFEHAYATYLNEVDSLIISISTDGGTSFNRLAALEGGPTVGTGMVTATPTSDPFVPNADQWAGKGYLLPPGTNRIQFMAKSAYGNNLYLDNIRVGKAYSNDVGIQDVVYPLFINLPFPKTPIATLKNFGTANQTTPFFVTMSITGQGYSYSSTKSDTVSANAMHQITFDNTFVPVSASTYNVLCYSSLGVDQNRTNDTLRFSVTAANANYGTNGENGSDLYFFTNSLGGNGAPAQASFAWKDTSGSTDLIVNGVAVAPLVGDVDDGYFTLTNLFPQNSFMSFGAQSDSNVYVSTNGVISFSGGNLEYSPSAIPSGDSPNGSLYALWTDFDFADPDVPLNRLSYKVDGDLLIITFARAPRFNSQSDSADYVSFQAILRFAQSHNSNSFAAVQFDKLQSGSTFLDRYERNSFPHLVGLENPSGTKAVTYRYCNGPAAQTHGPLFDSSLALTIGPSYESQVRVAARLFLEGPYSTSLHQMRTEINSLLPDTQPYNAAPWLYSGKERAVTIPDSIVDWVLFELRDSVQSTSRTARAAGLLGRGGTAHSANGDASILFELLNPSDYYVAVYQRNHLSVLSAIPLSLGQAASSYDFSLSQSQAYGLDPMNLLEPGVFGLVSGDVNRSAVITASDANGIFEALNGFGYSYEDANLSGIVTASDANLTFANLNRASGASMMGLQLNGMTFSVSSFATRFSTTTSYPKKEKRSRKK